MNVNMQRMADALPETEADVVIVTMDADMNIICVHPQWECDVPAADLPGLAARIALFDAESFGHGPFYAVYRDRRQPVTE